MSTPFFDVDAIIADRQTKIMICCGAGGVGKTTTSAALAVRAAECCSARWKAGKESPSCSVRHGWWTRRSAGSAVPLPVAPCTP